MKRYGELLRNMRLVIAGVAQGNKIAVDGGGAVNPTKIPGVKK